MIIAMDISQAESFGVIMGLPVAVVARTLRIVVYMNVAVSGMEVPLTAGIFVSGVGFAIT